MNLKNTGKIKKEICYIISLDLALIRIRRVVNIYALNDVSQQVSFFKELHEQLQEFSERETIIMAMISTVRYQKLIKKEAILAHENKG